jgi:photosystem II stability/assembly factor-like uncharacterized protein
MLLISSAITATSASPAAAVVETWTSHGPAGGAANSIVIDPSSPTRMYVGTNEGVFKTDSGGTLWGARSVGLGSAAVYTLAMDPLDHSTLYAATYFDGVFKSTDGAGHWKRSDAGITGSVGFVTVDPTNPDTIYACGFDGVFKSTDAGATWAASSNGMVGAHPQTLAVDPTDPLNLYVSSLNGFYKSTDGAASWTPANQGIGQDRILYGVAVDPSTPTTVYAWGWDQGVFKSTDAAAHWAPMNNGLSSPAGAEGFAIDPTNPSTLYVGEPSKQQGQLDEVFKSTDGAEHWVHTGTIRTNPSPNSIVVDPTLGSRVYVGTGSLGVVTSTNGGATWRLANAGLIATVVQALAVDPVAPDTVYAAMNGSTGLFKSLDAGRSWRMLITGRTSVTVNAVAADPLAHGTVYAGGLFTGIDKTADGGGTWTTLTQGLPISGFAQGLAVDPSAEGVVYAGLQEKGVYKTTDGAHWTASNNGLSAKNVNTLAIDPSDHLVLYAGSHSYDTGKAGVFKSTDGGATWTKRSVGLVNKVVQALAIDPSDTQVVYAGTAGGVFSSTDGAASWARILAGEDVRGVVVDPSDPATVYAGTYGDGVFVTRDGGATWSSVNEGLTEHFLYALAIDPVTGGTVHAGTVGGGAFELEAH